MIFIHAQIRRIIFCITIAVTILIVGYFSKLGWDTTSVKNSMQIFGLTAIAYLYLTLLISPLYSVFPFLQYKNIATKARKALGVSACFFATVHAFIGLRQLGGFEGLRFLPQIYLIPVILGAVAVTILLVMAATSIEKIISKLGYARWKFIHRFVYLASLFIVVHVLFLGSHFKDISQLIPRVFFVLLAVLVILESIRFYGYLVSKNILVPKINIFTGSALILFICLGYYFFSPKYLQLNSHVNTNYSAQPATHIPAEVFSYLKELEYNVSFKTEPTSPEAKTETKLLTNITFARSGEPVLNFDAAQPQIIQGYIVDDNLSWFTQIELERTDSNFSADIKFPHGGGYRIYVQFKPHNSLQQLVGFRVNVSGKDEFMSEYVANEPEKKIGDLTVTMKNRQEVFISEFLENKSELHFAIVSDKKFELQKNGSSANLFLVREGSYESLAISSEEHDVSPRELHFKSSSKDQFIKNGMYRAFLQMKINEQVLTIPFQISFL